MKRAKLALAGVLVAALATVALVAPSALAQSTEGDSDTLNARPSQARPINEQSENRTAISEARCTKAQAKIQNRVQQMAVLKANRTTFYDNIMTKSNTIISNASAAGYDTTVMTEAQAEVKFRYEAFITALDSYTEYLSAADKSACSEDAGQFNTALQESRKKIAATRLASSQLREAIVNDLLPSFTEYSGWLRNNQATANQIDDGDTPTSNTSDSSEPNPGTDSSATTTNPETN